MKTALVKIEGYHCSMLRAFESLLTQNYSSFILTAIKCFGVSIYDTSHNRGQRPQAREISSIGAVRLHHTRAHAARIFGADVSQGNGVRNSRNILCF